MSAELDGARRATLAGLADALVPAWEQLPAASEVGVHERRLDRVLAYRPELAGPLAALLDAAAGADPELEARRLHAEDPVAFDVLATVVTAGYYMHPRVQKLIGYPGQRRSPPAPDEADYYLDGGRLLDPVRALGPIHRPTPPAAEA